MTIDPKTIDIPRLVADIHKHKGTSYSTRLYTLRAWLRGKLHRLNPPAEIRDFNRSMLETGRPSEVRSWDAREHNERVAMGIAGEYKRPAQSAEVEARAAG